MIELENLSFQFSNGPLLLDHQSLSIAAGDLLIVTGAPACGKTTLMRLLRGELFPTLGSVKLQIHDRQKMGCIFQDQRILEHLTIIDNVALPLRVSGLCTPQIVDNVRELLAWFSLKADTFPHHLSASEKQKLCLARAVVHHPRLILADDPFQDFDRELRWRCIGLLQNLAKQGTTIVLAMQNAAPDEFKHWRRLHLQHGKLQ